MLASQNYIFLRVALTKKLQSFYHWFYLFDINETNLNRQIFTAGLITKSDFCLWYHFVEPPWELVILGFLILLLNSHKKIWVIHFHFCPASANVLFDSLYGFVEFVIFFFYLVCPVFPVYKKCVASCLLPPWFLIWFSVYLEGGRILLRCLLCSKGNTYWIYMSNVKKSACFGV